MRVSSPRSKVQQRIITKKITKIGCGSVYNFKNFNRWQPLLVKRALVFGWKIPLLSRKWLIDDRSMIGRDFSINSMVCTEHVSVWFLIKKRKIRFQCFFCFVNIERHTTRENSKYEKREFESMMEAMEVPYYLDYAH